MLHEITSDPKKSVDRLCLKQEVVSSSQPLGFASHGSKTKKSCCVQSMLANTFPIKKPFNYSFT